MKILHLTLKKKPFEVMAAGLKPFEVREPTQWIKSRLFDNKGKPKHYDFIKFRNGYNKESPFFYAKYCGYKIFDKKMKLHFQYKNGLIVLAEPGYYKIYFSLFIDGQKITPELIQNIEKNEETEKIKTLSKILNKHYTKTKWI